MVDPPPFIPEDKGRSIPQNLLLKIIEIPSDDG
jgi:hypothetical protein